ncbi:MAG: hypothetical protein LC127_14955, partial [Chitinophagales bacterium]|nr:hypothetical protein [Chitinophagales bacterium]
HDTTKVVDLTTAQTLTNKTLTSPKINEDVALTSTATELNLLHGQMGAWTSYTPSLFGVVLGSGTNIGYYQKIGKTVHYRAKVTLAANSSITGVIYVSPPTTDQNDTSSPIGLATLKNVNGAFYTGWLRQDGAIYIAGDNGVWTGTSATYPFTWETGDIIIVSGTYEAA